MNITDIKKLKDKSPVPDVRGTVEKQYPPKEPTENDIKFGQHNQSLLINDGEGEKLMVTLTKKQLHILDDVEGHEIVLTAGTNDKGESRGLLLNTWLGQKTTYGPSFALKVYPEATLRIVAPGGEVEQPKREVREESPAKTGNSPQAETVPSQGVTEFEKSLDLTAYGYCLCLDKAKELMDDRDELKTDSTNLRTIATILWMESKHKVRSLTPGLNAPAKPVAPEEPPTSPAPQPEQPDQTVIDRLVKGMRMDEAGELAGNGKAALDKLVAIANERGLWDKAYDQIVLGIGGVGGFDPKHNVRLGKALREAYKSVEAVVGKGNGVEKYIVSTQASWAAAVRLAFDNPQNTQL